VNEEYNPLTPIKYGEKKRSNITVRSNILERKTCTFYAYPNIIDGFKRYARFTGKTLAECFEAALIEYMQNHPLSQVNINVTVDMRAVISSEKDELKAKILFEELQTLLSILERNDENTLAFRTTRKKLHKALIQAYDLKHAYPRLENLIEKGRQYF